MTSGHVGKRVTVYRLPPGESTPPRSPVSGTSRRDRSQLPELGGSLVGVCGVDVLQGRLRGDAEDAHEVDGVGGGAGFVEKAVAA